MTQKNETPILIAALLITIGLVGAGFWWFTQKSGVNLGGILPQNSDATDAQTAAEVAATATPGNASTKPKAGGFAEIQAVPKGLFFYGGSTTWAPLRRDVDPVLQTAQPGFQLRYTEPTNATPGSSSGIRMLLSNQLAFAQSSRALKEAEYQQAQQRGIALKEIPVAIEGLAIAVNPSLNIAGLTLTQIKDIYAGKITNWNQVNGPNLPITPFSRRIEDGGTVDFFVDNLLTGEAFGPTTKFVANTTTALRQLANNAGGIYYASAPEVVGQCTIKPLSIGRQADEFIAPYQLPYVPTSECPARRNQVNLEAFRNGQYPITRRLFVVTKQDGQTDQQAGEAYAELLLTNQGQELITKAGFVRIK
ncbi:MAG: PstS family phosphate ABC transporter substrate-binding protein [Cyanothece sp. SIO1E1]|nr:PstS family phosphate ABC transporter substrate-binding protein [Cyanothece sp. SIO1E1]